jgi:hypothetical protein
MPGMRRLVTALLLGAALVCSAAPALAGATQDPGFAECLASAEPQIIEKGPPSCREENGHFVPYWDDEVSTGVGGGFIVTILLLGLIWSTVPAIASYHVAKNAGQPTGVAILLGLVLGWVGLLVVYLMSRSDTRAYAHGAVDAMGPRQPYPSPSYGFQPPPPPTAPAADPGTRLEVLDRLREGGQITDDEYAARRQTILDGI